MDIIGHAHQRDLLGKISRGDLPHHAFLFFGPEGVGKRLVALEFAASLLGFPGEDPSRKQDFLLINPVAKKDGGKRSISVDTVRNAGQFLSRFPAEARRRVVLIDDADRMTEEAQNALLKLLEEPNTSSVLLLVASRTGLLRDTVVSRTFRVPFSAIPEDMMRAGFGTFLSGEAAVEPFFFSLGRPGIVVGAAASPDEFSGRRDLLRSLFRISSLSFCERLSLSEKLSASPSEAAEVFEWWVAGLRNVRKRDDSTKAVVRRYRFLEDIEKTTRSLRDTNANVRLLLDRLFLVSL
ncbi:MAG: AAA family ATPase [Candidatus Moraniibacteriota bacterium]